MLRMQLRTYADPCAVNPDYNLTWNGAILQGGSASVIELQEAQATPSPCSTFFCKTNLDNRHATVRILPHR